MKASVARSCYDDTVENDLFYFSQYMIRKTSLKPMEIAKPFNKQTIPSGPVLDNWMQRSENKERKWMNRWFKTLNGIDDISSFTALFYRAYLLTKCVSG